MGAVAVHASRPLALVLAPVLTRQGAQVLRDTPVLPEPGGARRGVEGTGRPLDVLVVGESTAAGVGVQSQDQGLAPCFSTELADRTSRSVQWRTVARTGATASHVLRKLIPEAVGEEFDLAVVVLGANDALRLRPRRAWRRDMIDIIDALEARLRPGGTILLAGLPALGSFHLFPQPLRGVLGLHSRALDRVLDRIARGSALVFHAPLPPMSGTALFASDGFHPNGNAYAQWGAQLADLVGPRINR